MGNGAVSQDGSYVDNLDELVDKANQSKPASAKFTKGAGGSSTGFTSDETPHQSQNGISEKDKYLEAKREAPLDAKGSAPSTPIKVPSSKPVEPVEVPAAAEAKRETKVISKDKAAAAQSINPVKEHKKADSHDQNDDYSRDDRSDDDSAVEPVDVLLQFIPYYGQGDPANDSIVRSTLSSLSVEDIDSQDEYGNTLLLLACQYRCEDLVRIMLNKGADANAVNSSGACCLHFACYRESASIGVAKILLKSGADPDVAESTFGCTPLHYCAGTGDIDFCKLLLSYGAQIGALDFYNYTCVDYASEAGMTEVAAFLQKKLAASSNRLGMSGAMSSKNLMSPSVKNYGSGNQIDIANWESHIDPDSGGKYYIHIKTGECLWESELKQRIQQYQAQAPSRDDHDKKDEGRGRAASEATAPKISEADLIHQATQARLVVFFSTHDPARLVEVDKLTAEFAGKEAQLLKELCEKYKVDGGPELAAFQAKLSELRPTGKKTQVNDVKEIDPLLLQDLSREERKKFEAQLAEEIAALKKKYETQLEEEKASFIQSISEKEGVIAKLKSQIESLDRGKSSTEEDMKSMQEKLSLMTQSGGQAMEQLQSELEAAQAECKSLKAQLAELQQTLSYEKEKLHSLESTMSNLTSGNEELIAREQKAAEERAVQQRERDAQHNQELRALEDAAKNTELRLKTDLNHLKQDFAKKSDEQKDQQDQMRKAKDRDIDRLSRELAEMKAQYAQEISAAHMQITDFQKTVEDTLRRAEEAEAFQKTVQGELAEAKVVQKYNAQLHKDLQREQLARKKLHNDMEDMKGKIRVYVRVRPFSKSEAAKNCEESVVKDGKMTVLVKGLGQPDAKKYYDFDQVFGGQEGNTQADVFKDTKHLIMSVVDGYNVCIFAYGQTGAGKSFTMIGAADIANCMSENGDFDDLAGITPRAVSELFRLLNERTAQIDFVVEVQMFQLYRDGLDDLLKEPIRRKKGEDDDGKKPPPLKITLAEHSPTGLVFVEGAQTLTATTPGDVMKIFAKGSARRTTASTQMNAESSRSHLICSLVVKLKNKRTGKDSIGKLTLVDLAGSERVDKSGAAGEVLKEAQSINKSLSALGDVISALTTNQNHVPYRNHPLTMLMSDSIGGNAKTLMFVNTSPADYNTPESNSSLAFASRCKDITNAVAAGPGVQAAQVSALKKELAKLKKGGGGGGGPSGAGKPGPPPGGAMLARPDTALAAPGGRRPPE